MTAYALHLLEADRLASENVGDEQAGNSPASDLLDALVASNVVALSARLQRLEAQQREDRAAINRILTRFATLGQPIPAGDSAA